MTEIKEWAESENITVLARWENGGTPNFTNKSIDWVIAGWNLLSNTPFYRHKLHLNHITMDPFSGEPIDTVIIRTCSQLSTLSQVLALGKPTAQPSFSRRHFGVQFSSWETPENDEDKEYDKHQLTPIIDLIATRFGTILTSVPIDDINYGGAKFIPKAVAEYNAMRNEKGPGGKRHPLQVYVEVEIEDEQYFLDLLNEHSETHFEYIEMQVNAANGIFEDTVPFILLNGQNLFSTLSSGYLQARLAAALHVRKYRGNSTYKLGVTLPLTHCSAPAKIILRRVFIVIFRIEPNDSDLREGASHFVEFVIAQFNKCLSYMRANVGVVPTVGFHTAWPETPTNGRRNITAFKFVWQTLNIYAACNNVTVFMDSAFDRYQKIRGNTGWWQIVQNDVCNDVIEEYYVLEKISESDKDNFITDATNQTKEGTLTMRYAGKEIQLGAHRIRLRLFPDDAANPYGLHRLFSDQYFGVALNILLLDDAINKYSKEAHVEFLLNLVRTRFSRLLMTTIEDDMLTSKNANIYIPSVVATLNEQLRSPDVKKTFRTNSLVTKPLSLSIPFNFHYLALKGETAFNHAKKLAEEANSMSSGTVQFLIADMASVSHVDWAFAERKLTYFKEQVERNQSGSNNVGLGVKVSVPGLSERRHAMASLQKHVLPHVQLFLIDFSWDQYSDAPDLIKMFENCTVGMKGNFPNVTLGVISEWNDKVSNDVNPHGLIDFWQSMNKYSTEKNTLVYLRDAFDASEGKVTVGWWRVAKDKGDYQIYEKYQLLLNTTSFAQDEAVSKSLRSIVVDISIGVVLISIVVVIVGVAVLLNRRNSLASLSKMSDVELLEFFEGRRKSSLVDKNQVVTYCSIIKHFHSIGYDQTLEVEKDAFRLDKARELGEGKFGKVCMGRLCVAGRPISVAVKRTNSGEEGNENVTSLRSLLSEIKVLSYLGKHDSIVALLGAHTSNIRKGEVFIFLELCSVGSLLKHLRKLKKPEQDENPYLDLGDSTDDKDDYVFAKWSLNIADGMEFLASKHVVHADLATRNVLLDSNKNAKICDFGLSRRMMNYKSYFKTQQEPLPWRWMAPESLRCHEFNEQTDVWAFGVTLWEIITLGDVPYPGMSWRVDFTSLLENGLRLLVPQRQEGFIFCEKELHSVMNRCLEINPKERPSFSMLRDMINDILIS